MHLQFFDDASDEVEESRAWYQSRSESAEAAFLRELDHAVDLIQEAPSRWPKYIAGTRRYVFPRFPYSIIYFVENDTINVVAVAHGKRKPGYWRERLRR